MTYCATCGHETAPGVCSESYDIGNTVLVVTGIPCYKCSACGEILFSGDTVARLEKIVATASGDIPGVAIVSFDTAA